MATLAHSPDRHTNHQLPRVGESLGNKVGKFRLNISYILGEIFVSSEPKFRAQEDKREAVKNLPTAKSQHLRIF